MTILTNTHTGPYGFKNFVQNNVYSLQACLQWNVMSKKASKTFFFELVLEYSPAQGEASFCAEIRSFKAAVGRIATCACLCEFSARLVHAWSFADF